ncbi:MAG: azurin [Pseudomonadota bacterium]
MARFLRLIALPVLLMSGAYAQANCEVSISAGDGLAYDKNSIEVSSDCAEVTVTLTHTGNLPAAAMGHNWVLSLTDDLTAIATEGMSAGADANYVNSDDPRVIAASSVVGGGESTSVTFSISELDASKSYSFFCTFPGHWSVMKGSFVIS